MRVTDSRSNSWSSQATSSNSHPSPLPVKKYALPFKAPRGRPVLSGPSLSHKSSGKKMTVSARQESSFGSYETSRLSWPPVLMLLFLQDSSPSSTTCAKEKSHKAQQVLSKPCPALCTKPRATCSPPNSSPFAPRSTAPMPPA